MTPVLLHSLVEGRPAACPMVVFDRTTEALSMIALAYPFHWLPTSRECCPHFAAFFGEECELLALMLLGDGDKFAK